METLSHARPQTDQFLHAVSRKKRIAENLLRLLPNAIHTTCPLNKPNDGPREVEVHYDGGVLEILAFAQHIRRDEDTKLLVRWNLVAFLVARGAEPPSISSGVFVTTSDPGETLQTSGSKLRLKISHCVGELREDNDLVVAMLLRKEGKQRLQFGVGLRLPITAATQDVRQTDSVRIQVCA